MRQYPHNNAQCNHDNTSRYTVAKNRIIVELFYPSFCIKNGAPCDHSDLQAHDKLEHYSMLYYMYNVS